MRHLSQFMVAAALCLLSSVTEGASFVIGVAPHTSARVILEMYQPLRLSLQRSLGMEVEVVTAPDFDEFARRGLAGEYDIAITTGHQARLLETEAGYLPLLTYKADFRAVALVAAKDPVRSAQDLKGKKILGLSPTSLVTMWGQHWLAGNGLGNTPLRYVSASDSVGQLVAAGDAAAGFTSLVNFQKLPSGLRAQLRILAESPPMTGRVYLLGSRHAMKKEEVEAALWGFAATPEGRSYFGKNHLDGYRKLKPKELEGMDIYAGRARKLLGREMR